MKKLILLLLITSFCHAQRISEYKASNGITYKEGDTIKLGMGSGNRGTFVYLQIGGWMAGDSTPIGSNYNGLNVIIAKIKKFTFKGAEKVVFSVKGGNITNYNLMIEDAISVCEIKDCIEKKPIVINESDKYDKLKKLKELFDSGTLTKEEYEKEKKMLLDEK